MKLLLPTVLALVLLFASTQHVLSEDSGGDTIEEQMDKQDDCVTTPAEFIAAFIAKESRCVSDDLVGRLTSGKTVNTSGLFNTNKRLAYFWSGSDVLSKYLSFGFPEIVGFSTQNNPAGLTSMDNGVAFLQQVGYPFSYADISKVYTLNVLTKKALEQATAALEGDLPFGGGVGPLIITWEAARSYFQFVFEYAGLTISDDAIAILSNTSFSDLTACPPECAYSWADFPSGNRTTPMTTKPANSDGSCPPPDEGAVVALPTSLVVDSKQCDADWLNATAATALFDYNCTHEVTAQAGTKLAALLAEAESPRQEALLFRAFLTQHCTGNFNSLFSGDGLTYTGYGALLSPLGTEAITSPFSLNAWGSDEIATVSFCISGTNGGKPNAQGACDMPTA